jgi:CO/xanthine dehydrogenase FAD-binding subunit
LAVKEYFLPKSLAEAVGLLAEHGPSLLVMAGGTLAMPLINEGISLPEKVMGLRQAGLAFTRRENGALIIGATTTLTQTQGLADLPLLAQAARHAGGWSICNMGTIGGNIFAPPPAGDVAVALLALEARVKLTSQNGDRTLPLADFYTGFMTHALEPHELLTEIQVSLPAGKTVYLKHGRRQAVTPAVVTVAAHIVEARGKVTQARLALNGVGPHPFRPKNAEAALVGSTLSPESIAAAAQATSEACDPFSDAIASEWYRRRMAGTIVKRALSQLAGLES